MTSGTPPNFAAPRKKQGRGAIIFLILFALPFCGFGIFALVGATNKAMQGVWRDAAFLALFGVIFAGVGALFIWGALRGSKLEAVHQSLRDKHPSAPWNWREDWVAGRIPAANKSAALGAWIFATLWNLISLPLLFLVPNEVFKKGNIPALLGLLFPMVGVGLLVRAIRMTIQWRKFGESALVLDTVPAAIGGVLAGRIEISPRAQGAREFQLRLTCVNMVETGSGKSRSTSERILWQEVQTVGLSGQGNIPVSFFIPADCRECDDSDADNRIVWKLDATAKVAGVDFAAAFEAPVFNVALTESQLAVATSVQTRTQQALRAYQRPVDSPILVRAALHGGTEFIFPACRNPNAAMVTTVFLAIWSGIFWFLILKAPLFFVAIWGIFEVLILWGTIELWFGSTRVSVSNRRVVVSHRWLGIPLRRREIFASEIAEIKTKVGMTMGQTAFHDLVILLSSGRKVGAGGSVRNKLEAEWLAAEISRIADVRK